MTTVSNGYPLYARTFWPGPHGLQESDSVVQPGGTLTIDGETIIAIPKSVDVHDPEAQPRWEASLSRDSRTPSALEALPDGSVAPYTFGHPKASGFTPQYLVATQCFKLPFMPGTSHLTLIARSVAGQVLYREDFNVHGTQA